jgi:hypothetical protein
LPIIISTSTRFTFTGCRNAGLNTRIDCPNATLTTTTLTAAGSTAIGITGVNCTLALVADTTCNTRVTGGLVGSYDNTAHEFTVDASNQSLVSSGSTCTNTFLNGTTTFSGSAATNIVYSVAPTTTINVV